MRRISPLVPVLLLCASVPAAAQTTLTPQISGNTVTASTTLPGGIDLDLTISFEQVVGLNPSALTLTAGLVNPTDPSIVSLFPDPTSISIPSTFPVLVQIVPVSTSGLSFSGVCQVFIHTHALTLTTNSPLRVFKSHAGGTYQDITTSLESGSVRGGGTTDNMSDFLIVSDLRPTDTVISGKFSDLQNQLTANASAIDPAVYASLQQQLGQAQTYYNQGDLTDAISAVTAFSNYVYQQSGANIPNVWQANGSLVNVAGVLRSGANTLNFSLTAKANGSP